MRAEVERSFQDLWVEGEISDLRIAASGHIYFNLKDDGAQLAVVMFRRQAGLLRFRPEDGLQVLLRGRLTVYEQRGSVQIVAEHLEPMGAGSLQMAFEQVKAQLQREGLFDQERKKPLPAFPHCVGIITSPTGAVIRDFLNVAGRRHGALKVLLYPALVQGDSAAAEVAAGIRYFNQSREVDVIVIARGGGSLEDLMAFNSEALARVIAASELPVVSAVGHETDFTIADFVADLRAPTPSAAAELITVAQHRIEEQVEELSLRLQRAARYALMRARDRLSRIAAPAALARFEDALQRRQQRIDELMLRLQTHMGRRLQHEAMRWQQMTESLMRHDVRHRLRLTAGQLDALGGRLMQAQQAELQRRRARVEALERMLHSLSPLGVLERGYALVYDDQGRLLRSSSEAQPGQTLRTRLAQGTVESRVITTSEDTTKE
ncbi:exodeoxyribonuclease 7 large subunit [Silvibacterium dinghuense]|nr:exodeoxyribonuclease 7 large subunit [Silvibacterium dinghuense]